MGKKLVYFMDFELDTENSTFHPRPETEILVEKALAFFPTDTPCHILDIGTGCGNIAISLTKYISLSKIVALDISDSVLRTARENAKRYGVENRIRFVKSDLFKNIKNYRSYFDLIISNPPYISLEDFTSLSWRVKQDPYIALYGGIDGLSLYKQIIKEAPLFLKSGGLLLMETGYNQASHVRNMLNASGAFQNIKVHKDYSGIERIIQAERKNIKLKTYNLKLITLLWTN